MKANVNVGVEGWYRIKRIAPDGKIRQDTGWFKNLITDNGLDLMWTTPAGAFSLKYFLIACCVGSGNSTPDVTDTTLETLVATVTDIDGSFGATTFVDEAGAVPAYWKAIASWRFPTGAAAGNLSEIGAGHSNTNLFSRALIVDGGGSPTTITVLSDEVLDVTYELRVYIDKTPVPFTIDISGDNYSGYIQPYNIDGAAPGFSYAWNTGSSQANLTLKAWSTHTEPADVYASATGSGFNAGGALINSYIVGTYFLDLRCTWPQSQANVVGGINLFTTLYGFTSFMLWFDDPILKQDFQTLYLDVRLSWDRYAP